MSSPLLWGPNSVSSSLENKIGFPGGGTVAPSSYVAGDFDSGLNSWALGTVTLSGLNPSSVITGGASSLNALALVTAGTLEGVQSLRVSSSAAWSAGQGFYAPFSVGAGQQSKMQQITFEYNISSGASNCDVSGTSTSTFAVGVYDIANASWVMIQPAQFGAINGAKNVATVFFQVAAGAGAHQLFIFAQNASAGAVTMILDNIQVQPMEFAGYGVIGTDPVAYTPTFGAGFGTPSAVSFTYARQGKNLIIQGTFTAGTVSAAPATITMPSGLLADSSLAGLSGAVVVVGNLTRSGTNTQLYTIIATSGSNTLGISLYNSGGGANPLVALSGVSSYFNSSDLCVVDVVIPIQGWSSQSQVISQYDGRVVATQVTSSTSNMTVAAGVIVFPVISYDLQSAYNTSTGLYTCPVSGIYTVSLAGVYTSPINLAIYKNGAYALPFIQTPNAVTVSGTVDINCNAGDTLSLYNLNAATAFNYSAGTYQPILSFSLKSGAQQILNNGVVTSVNSLSGALNLTAGTGVTITPSGSNIQISASSGSGTVTSASVVTANGFAGTVANATTTPAITLTTTASGVLKGSASQIVAATAGTDYVIPSGSITGTAANITATSNSTLTTLSALSLPGSQVSGNISGNAANVTGTVAIANGGTNNTSFTSGALDYFNGTAIASAPGITTDGAGNLTVSGNIVSNGGINMWTNGTNYMVSRGIFSN